MRNLTDEPVHEWFGLSYAHYLVLPRLALQTMPPEWQQQFVECLNQLDDAIDFVPEGCEYHVQLRDSKTKRCVSLSRDPLNDYRHGTCEIKIDRGNREVETRVPWEHEAVSSNLTSPIAGPSSNGRTPGCEPGEVGSIPTGPSKSMPIDDDAMKNEILYIYWKTRAEKAEAGWAAYAWRRTETGFKAYQAIHARLVAAWKERDASRAEAAKWQAKVDKMVRYQCPTGPASTVIDAYLVRMNVMGLINRERNWLGIVAEAIQHGCGFNLTGCGNITNNIWLVRKLRCDYHIVEVW